MPEDLSKLADMGFKNDEELEKHLHKVADRVKCVHEDRFGCVYVVYSGKDAYNLNVVRHWHDESVRISWALPYNIFGKAMLKIGVYYMGIKGF